MKMDSSMHIPSVCMVLNKVREDTSFKGSQSKNRHEEGEGHKSKNKLGKTIDYFMHLSLATDLSKFCSLKVCASQWLCSASFQYFHTR